MNPIEQENGFVTSVPKKLAHGDHDPAHLNVNAITNRY